MMAKTFEDLIVWQKARLLTKKIYELTKSEGFSRDFRLVGQMRASSTSVMSNIAEGFERYSKAEFHQGVVHSKGSAGELRSQLYVAYDAGYIDEPMFGALLADSTEVSKLLEALRRELFKAK